MQRKGAMERRLDGLHDQWMEFARQPEARLLRWVVEPDEVRMVEAWLKKEGDEQAGECPDLLLRFDIPFDQPETYGLKLLEALTALVEESGEPVCLGEMRPGQPGTEAFLSACEALHGYCAQVCDVLAVVLVPERVVDGKAWQQWLWKALELLRSPHVRLVVLDDTQERLLEPMAQLERERVKTVVAGLDMARALRDVSREAGQLDTPGGQYRELLARLAGAAQRGELGQVEQLGGEAVALASGQGWHGLAMAAHWVVAGALLAAGQIHEATERYRRAEAAALEAEAQGEAQGAPLRLKARMALGAALVVAQDWGPAAVLFEEPAPLALRLADATLGLECWRMGSLCREFLRELDKAWADGQQAWEVGRGLEPQARAVSTLPYVAEALVRLGRARQGEQAAEDMEAEARQLLGTRWRPAVHTAGGQAA
jgi:hypothetical protein